MAKLQDVELKKLGSQALTDFKDDVRNLLNNGKAQFQFLSSSTGPTFAGNAGEIAFVLTGASGALYVYSGFAWDLAAIYTATTA